MTKAEHLAHAQHNEKACRHVNDEGSLYDWVITTAFYSALHYVSHTVFPCDCFDKDRVKVVSVPDLSMYYKVFSNAPNKHQALIELVDENCNEIMDAYDWLYSTCMSARYSKYRQPEKYAQKAVRYLEEIRNYCTA